MFPRKPKPVLDRNTAKIAQTRTIERRSRERIMIDDAEECKRRPSSRPDRLGTDLSKYVGITKRSRFDGQFPVPRPSHAGQTGTIRRRRRIARPQRVGAVPSHAARSSSDGVVFRRAEDVLPATDVSDAEHTGDDVWWHVRPPAWKLSVFEPFLAPRRHATCRRSPQLRRSGGIWLTSLRWKLSMLDGKRR